MPRSIWKGHLSFGLVMIPVALYGAEAAESKLDFDLLDKRDNARVRYKRVNEASGKEVPWESIVKGHQTPDGKYVIVNDEDFKAAGDAVVRGVEIVEFVNREEITPLYFEKPYYLEPGKNGEKGYVLLRETMKKSNKVGIANMVLHTRQHLAALMVEGDALVLITIRFAAELRSASDFKIPAGNSGKFKVTPREVAMAEQLVSGMAGRWEPRKFHDEYHDALVKVIAQKAKSGGKSVKALPEAAAKEVVSGDIMALLKKSLAGGSVRTSGAAKQHGSGRSRRGVARKRASS